MDSQWTLPLITAAAAGLLVWSVMRTRCRRRVSRWAHRLLKAEGKLDTTKQQLAQARKQVDKLQRELSEAHRAIAVASSQLGSQRATMSSSKSSNKGFADTMPM
jgi:chromosome segregation ATPase